MRKEDERDEKKKKCHEKLIRLCCWIIRHLEFSFLFFVNLSMIPFFRIINPKKIVLFFFSLITSFFCRCFPRVFFFLNEFLLVKFQLCKRGGKKPWEETRTSWASEIFFFTPPKMFLNKRRNSKSFADEKFNQCSHTLSTKRRRRKKGFLFGVVICSSIVDWTAE